MDNTSDYPNLQTTITRYLSYGWAWRVIVAVVNRQYGTSYTVAQLKKLQVDGEGVKDSLKTCRKELTK